LSNQIDRMSSKQSSITHWEKFWKDKEQIEEVYSNEDRIYLNLRKVTELRDKKILEVGAGSGRDSFHLAQENAMVYVLDYSPQALKIVNNLNDQSDVSVYLIQGDAFQIPIPDETLDIVFHQGLMEHFTDPLPLLNEHFRVLKPGGFLLVDVPQRYHIYTLIKHILIFFNKWFAGWETEFSIGQLKKLMKQSDFVVRHEYGRWMRPSLFYRMIREVLKKIKIRLPLYPTGLNYTTKLRDWLRDRFLTKRWAFYTFLDIGVIGQKKEGF
jgi:ubiquinone/menaquinone biosynthesis C-methylase UbiE